MGCLLSGNPWKNQGISNRTQEIMLDSWRSGTKKQYDVYLRNWNLFASRGGVDPIQPPVSKVLDFLTELYDCGLGYSALNTARCALSTIITLLDRTMTIGSHPLIQRFIKAAFQTRPAFPRYQTTWDTSVVLNFLKEWHPVNTLSLQHLTFKLVMLCALTTGQMCQSFHFMSLSSMQKSESSYTFVIDHLVKSSAPGQPQPVLVLPQFPADSRFCVVTTLEEYLRRTAPLRGNADRLFISYISPYKSVRTDTIGRWIKTVMALAGIDVSKFKAHSTRMASSSKAKACHVPTSSIMKAASWRIADVFSMFYNKPVAVECTSFGEAILRDADD